MNERHREVHNWLQTVYGGENVPQYEVNTRNIKVLYGLMQTNLKQDASASIILEDLRQKTEEYRAESERLYKILEKLEMTPGMLSQSGTVSLKTLTSVAQLLQTCDASDSSLLLAMSEQSQMMLKVKDSRRVEQRFSEQLFTKTKSALLRYNSWKKALEQLEEQSKVKGPELEKKAKQAGFLQSKAKEYKSHLHDLKRELTASGADPSIYHQTLCKKEEELKTLRDRLAPLKAKLDSYHKLPPDLALAQVKVEEGRREVAALEEELARGIDLMHV